MRRIICTFMALLLAVSMVFSFASCSGEKGEIKTLIKNYENACNDLDMEAILDCINPSIASKIELATGVLGMLTGADSDELFDKLSGLLSTEALGGKDFFGSLKIKVKDIEIDGDTAVVTADISYTVKDKSTQEEATIDCVRVDDVWYVGTLGFN